MGFKAKLILGGIALMLSQAALLPAAEPAPQPVVRKRNDPRFQLLKRFFDQRACPAADWAADFLIAADRNGLDWRLLPSIAFLESSGGKYYQSNNPLGWNRGITEFRSTRHAVHYVANRLAKSPIYQKKTLRTKLRIYNPENVEYPDAIMSVMEQIGPHRGNAAATQAPRTPPRTLQATLKPLR